MGIKQVVLDDFDGKVLDSASIDEPTVVLGLDRKRYRLWLSEANEKKLMKALEPFIDGAEEENATAFASARTSTKTTRTSNSPWTDVDAAEKKLAREYAQDIDWKSSTGKSVGDRGRIPDEFYDVWVQHKASL